jgi:multidrug resistance efflux pump
MIWKRKNRLEQGIAGQARNDKADNKTYQAKRSEEVADIIDRMPTKFGNWVAAFVVLFAALLLVFGWIIKYPDVVTGAIKINSNATPVKLVANMSGKIHLLNFHPQDTVEEGEYIAVIQNPAKTEDVCSVAQLLTQVNPNNKTSLMRAKNLFPEEVSMGELNALYYTFLSALKNSCSYEEENVFEQQKTAMEDEIKWKKIVLLETEEALKITEENLDISKKWYEKYATLNSDVVATYEYEVDRSKGDYLSAKQNRQNLKKDAASIQMQITETENRLAQLTIEKREKERALLLELLSSYHDLDDNIKMWEQKYVLKSPFDGKVEFLRFWSNDQFVQAGTDVFGIIPKENIILGQMHLPANGAGKVKTGSKVSIKLENYPYLEFGSIEGKVKSISLVSQEYKSGENSLETYLVLVDLPEGLKTNYEETLDFKYEIGGLADIIVNDRRLIERLFDNLKYRTK